MPDVRAELERRAKEVKPPSRVPAIVALVAALGGPAVLVPLVTKALDTLAATAAQARAKNDAQDAALRKRLDEAAAACGRAETLARDAKSQSDATGARLDSFGAKPSRR